MVKIYGIPNCDTVKKACKWLDNHGIEYEFIDFRKTPLTTAQLKNWADSIGLEKLLNKRSRTWRDLDKSGIDESNSPQVLKLLQEMPTLIKRPVLQADSEVFVGFDNKQYEKYFGYS